MEVNIGPLMYWHNQPDYVKGNKSYQYVSSAGLRLYFDSTGQPRNVSDDTPVTDLEMFITGNWVKEYYYDITSVSIGEAISAYKSGSAGKMGIKYVEEVMGPNPARRVSYHKSDKPVEIRSGSYSYGQRFTIDELLSGNWFVYTDAY